MKHIINFLKMLVACTCISAYLVAIVLSLGAVIFLACKVNPFFFLLFPVWLTLLLISGKSVLEQLEQGWLGDWLGSL